MDVTVDGAMTPAARLEQRMREEGKNHQIEQEGKELRSHMDWIQTEF